MVMVDEFPVLAAQAPRLVFEECNVEWRQGLALSFKGELRVNDQSIRRGLVLWRDTAPQAVDLFVVNRISKITLKNVWDTGDGVIHSWHNGAAMIIEPLSRGRRYRCNDGLADEDFDDLVFRMERVGPDWPEEGK